MTDVWQVQVAAPSKEAAVVLAQSAVKARLAASAQISGPLTSVFWHLGDFGTSEEWQVVFKTTSERYQELENHLVEHHEWKNPEISAIPVVAALAPYVEWVLKTTSE